MQEVRVCFEEFQNIYPAQKKSVSETVMSFHSEADVPSILKIDGIDEADFENENLPKINVTKLLGEKNNSSEVSWCRRVVNTESNSATIISQLPGEGNRLHFHPDWNEWWYILDGQWEWEIEGETMQVAKGDLVFIEKGKLHRITAIGDRPAVRLAVSRSDVAHVYPDDVLDK